MGEVASNVSHRRKSKQEEQDQSALIDERIGRIRLLCPVEQRNWPIFEAITVQNGRFTFFHWYEKRPPSTRLDGR